MRECVSAQVGGGIHRRATGRLDGEQFERPVAGAEEEPAVRLCEHARRVCLCQRARGGHSEQQAIVELQAGADVGVKGAHDALELDGRPRGVKKPVLGADLLGIGDALLRLLTKGGPVLSALMSSRPPSAESRGASVP